MHDSGPFPFGPFKGFVCLFVFVFLTNVKILFFNNQHLVVNIFYYHYIISSLFSLYQRQPSPFLLPSFCQGYYLPFMTVPGKTCWKQEREWTTLDHLLPLRLHQLCR